MPITINRALNYNEQKVQLGKATCIGEGNMLLPVSCMNFYQKLDAFEANNKLNDRARTKTIHISLNFDPSEKHSAQKLNLIASTYMKKIGFGDQPYLVYEHRDAGHPHIHIVSTTIRSDGSRIPTHNIGREKSEPARKQLEEIFALVPAAKQEKIKEYSLYPIEIEKAQYGYSETRRSIANIVTQVLDNYSFTSLPLLNAILRQYNVIADQGKDNGFIRLHNGLQFRLLDEHGNKIGVPIKASRLPGQPTLKHLEELFMKKQNSRDSLAKHLKEQLERQLLHKPKSIQEFKQLLRDHKVQIMLRSNAEGRVYGITFIDLLHKSAFNGSELGKGYSIAVLQKLFEQNNKDGLNIQKTPLHFDTEEALRLEMLEHLLKTEKELEQTPFHLRKRKKSDNDY